ncbi:alpha-1,2-fucosyltransferase [Chitinophaga sp. SYP-B3965]|uniref:alpha-1,2-fucosyltransferase n=1 Tax=Chitinophaga sp. SYP-B3965 TaxID=2663120 RepID=UPI001299BC84|nr:alpha-1,2-fucosyltransferase [Chitinophaga sp. SYP-B3965]MRG47953.1 alpha-1,2-fucosyltransferase [Chitinophaga sp. SYP-B3965]
MESLGMIIVKLMGGLGNQMFQYALGKALSLQHQTTLKLDLNWLHDHAAKREAGFVHRNFDLDIFRIQVPVADPEEVKRVRNQWIPVKRADRLVKTLLGIPQTNIRERCFHYAPSVLKAGPDAYLDGFWQSEKYFRKYAPIIRADFSFQHPLGATAVPLMERILQSEAVCVNVRRKEYVNNPYHGAMDVDYYMRAEKWIRQKVKDPHLYIFSDDIAWCEANLHFQSPATFVPLMYAGEKYRDIFRMMIACKHYIIPNSSFGWWAAWLCNHKGKQVVAPLQWFARLGPKDTQDLLPEGWMRL